VKCRAAWLASIAVIWVAVPAIAAAPTRIVIDRVDCRLFVRHAPGNVSRPYDAKRDATLAQDDAFRCASPGTVSYHVLGREKIVTIAASDWFTIPHLPTAAEISGLKRIKEQLELERGGRVATGKDQRPGDYREGSADHGEWQI
jgi:hypothetical protein